MSENEVIRTILNRRSVREYTDREIPREVLETLVKAGVWAPTGKNAQSWRFTVLHTPERIAELENALKAAAEAVGSHAASFHDPRAMILLSNEKDNDDGAQDCSCAAENIMLAACSLGLGSVWLNPLMRMGELPEVREELRSLGIPDSHKVWAAVALGYPASTPAAPPRKQDVIAWID